MPPVKPTDHDSVISFLVTANASNEQTMSKFWEMEEPPQIHLFSFNEKKAEKIITSFVQ